MQGLPQPTASDLQAAANSAGETGHPPVAYRFEFQVTFRVLGFGSSYRLRFAFQVSVLVSGYGSGFWLWFGLRVMGRVSGYGSALGLRFRFRVRLVVRVAAEHMSFRCENTVSKMIMIIGTNTVQRSHVCAQNEQDATIGKKRWGKIKERLKKRKANIRETRERTTIFCAFDTQKRFLDILAATFSVRSASRIHPDQFQRVRVAHAKKKNLLVGFGEFLRSLCQQNTPRPVTRCLRSIRPKQKKCGRTSASIAWKTIQEPLKSNFPLV